MVKQRLNRNKMVSLCREDGSSLCGQVQVAKEAVSHFQQILSSERATPYPGKHVVEQHINKCLNSEQILDLGKDVTCEEISAAFHSIHPNKAPGLDGFNGYFFKKT